MTDKELPEWFNDKIEQWLFEEGISENSWTFDMLKYGSEWAFRELSKPENAAKICPNCKEQNEKNSEE